MKFELITNNIVGLFIYFNLLVLSNKEKIDNNFNKKCFEICKIRKKYFIYYYLH